MDPQQSDPKQLGYSLANVAEILLPCLEAARAKSVLEIGAYRGELTGELLDWAAGSGAGVTAVEPDPRRDTYYAPERIPEEQRQPLAHNAGLAPGEPGVVENGLPFTWAAEREGGEGNGTLTAIEDFMAERAGLRLAVVP